MAHTSSKQQASPALHLIFIKNTHVGQCSSHNQNLKQILNR